MIDETAELERARRRVHDLANEVTGLRLLVDEARSMLLAARREAPSPHDDADRWRRHVDEWLVEVSKMRDPVPR